MAFADGVIAYGECKYLNESIKLVSSNATFSSAKLTKMSRVIYGGELKNCHESNYLREIETLGQRKGRHEKHPKHHEAEELK